MTPQNGCVKERGEGSDGVEHAQYRQVRQNVRPAHGREEQRGKAENKRTTRWCRKQKNNAVEQNSEEQHGGAENKRAGR